MGKITFPEESLKPTLDSLLSDDLPVSPPVEVEIGQASLTIAFKALSRREMQAIQLQTRKWAHEQIRKAELPVDDVDSAYVLDLVTNELELRLLHASMVDPASKGGRGPAVSLNKLREKIRPGQQTKLNEQWFVWQTAHDHDELDADQIEEMIDAAQRGDYPFLLKFGSGGLLSCITTLAVQRETLQTDKSSDGGFSEVVSNDTSKEKGFLQNVSSLSELYARLSGLEVKQDRLKSKMEDLRGEVQRELRGIKERAE
ncbi:MAG: hypothetical protein ACYTEQ_19290 [Planctomycetota bacterium]|jgi:hypothetical protein